MAPSTTPWDSLPAEIRLMIYRYCLGRNLLLISRRAHQEVYAIVWRNSVLLLKPHRYGPACEDPFFRASKAVIEQTCFCPCGGDTITDKRMLSMVRSLRVPLPDDFFIWGAPSDIKVRPWKTNFLNGLTNLTNLDFGNALDMLDCFPRRHWPIIFPSIRTIAAHVNHLRIYVNSHNAPRGQGSHARVRLTQRLRDDGGLVVASEHAIRRMISYAKTRLYRLTLDDSGASCQASWMPRGCGTINFTREARVEFRRETGIPAHLDQGRLRLQQWKANVGGGLVMDMSEWGFRKIGYMDVHEALEKGVLVDKSWSLEEMRQGYLRDDADEDTGECS